MGAGVVHRRILRECRWHLVRRRAGTPPFRPQALHDGKFVEITEQSLKGHWSAIVFMPAAFTFNCPTEVEDAAEHHEEFRKRGREVYVVTTETRFAHKVWHETSSNCRATARS